MIERINESIIIIIIIISNNEYARLPKQFLQTLNLHLRTVDQLFIKLYYNIMYV
jgi:hypothetical protein